MNVQFDKREFISKLEDYADQVRDLLVYLSALFDLPIDFFLPLSFFLFFTFGIICLVCKTLKTSTSNGRSVVFSVNIS